MVFWSVHSAADLKISSAVPSSTVESAYGLGVKKLLQLGDVTALIGNDGPGAEAGLNRQRTSAAADELLLLGGSGGERYGA
ncbi:hypothetical protein [Paenibacillus sp. HW567]|uniref:hypothetical protein n=1 Tax=Paenibacillus sp. HW567 TaxID=1034769 RepID=UPI00036AB82F|nr:hypothetical protein [Paenibacillus sp. HW567]